MRSLKQASRRSHKHHPTRKLLAAILAAGLLTLTSCGDQPAPISTWEVTWHNTLSTVDEASTPDATRDQCEDILAYLRVQRTVLSPMPLDDLETPVDAWFAEAEAIFFECDLANASQESLETLQTLEAEVETVLELEG